MKVQENWCSVLTFRFWKYRYIAELTKICVLLRLLHACMCVCVCV